MQMAGAWNSNLGNVPIYPEGERLCSMHIDWEALRARREAEVK